ncbi:hypothetical protein, unlikely [Trypanosoma brucei gambiense DAL972]|uniref:Uncharacterized protein n=1 Tax=Trypanosoma brucei gambiense (strain MHOM/CI/86/DAL972) TaxID=679716 RepID=D0A1H1_TRYB9|nr:hypothetical protein, unlikely [Trypanosoma brucei gambiense DAL972]CBH15113.1 hypothetical protein, unlikely [Trypanosoma brucei gambiense DAL972]|eukprot:XP_011777379.1 hypothetical protein, unlikely [Trypanosoma brucei gambiense DAL972]
MHLFSSYRLDGFLRWCVSSLSLTFLCSVLRQYGRFIFVWLQTFCPTHFGVPLPEGEATDIFVVPVVYGLEVTSDGGCWRDRGLITSSRGHFCCTFFFVVKKKKKNGVCHHMSSAIRFSVCAFLSALKGKRFPLP